MRSIGHWLRLLAGAACAMLPATTLCEPAWGPNYYRYQVKMPATPTTAQEAAATVQQRKFDAIETYACGDEIDYAEDAAQNYQAGEDTTNRVLAKLAWAIDHPPPRVLQSTAGYCYFSRTYNWYDFNTPAVCALYLGTDACITADQVSAQAEVIWPKLVAGDFALFKDKVLQRTMPPGYPGCVSLRLSGGVTADRSLAGWRLVDPHPPSAGKPTGHQGALQLDFAISQDCLFLQVAQSLTAFVIPVKDGQQMMAGTDGGRCHLFTKIYGDWDMAERNLIRIAYLIQLHGLDRDGSPLHDAYLQLRNRLLTLDQGLEGDAPNAVADCGQGSGHTGSAEDRADDRDNFLQEVGNDLADWGWLAFLAFLALLIAAILAALLAALGLAGALAVAIGVAVAILGAAVFAAIPETENHLLAINSTKYLNNQLIIRDLGPDSDLAASYIDDQKDLKKWLLGRMQTYLQSDFIEYNARPYQRHAIESIRNVFDFADAPADPAVVDADLRNAARLVLDYTSAKFAVGASQSRRMVPYRRHRSDFAAAVEVDATNHFNGLLDFAASADHQEALGLLYAGQNQQLPLGQASIDFAPEVLDAATSDYVPEATILDLAIAKDVPIFQRIHHASEEIYSSDAGYVLSSGGLPTGLAYPVTGIPLIDGDVDDWGSGVPTTLFLAGTATVDLSYFLAPAPVNPTDPLAIDLDLWKQQRALPGPGAAPTVGPNSDLGVDGLYSAYYGTLSGSPRLHSTIGESARIDGAYSFDTDKNDDGTTKIMPTYDHNLCLWDGFACGINIDVVALTSTCPISVASSTWIFIDSARCSGRASAPRTLIAIFQKPCPPGLGCRTYGFIEVISALRYAALHPTPGRDAFDAFRLQVEGDNSLLEGLRAGPGSRGSYRSTRGQTLEFSCWAHQSDDDDWGVYKVDGVSTHQVDQWPFAGGEWTGAGSMLPPGVQTPMIAGGDGKVVITSPHLRNALDARQPKVLTLDFRNGDHPAAPVEQ